MPAAANSRVASLHLLFFASGAVGLVYEILWMRRLTVLFGASAPATAATLSAFFLGLGIGSALIGRFAARIARPLRAFAFVEIGTGLAALATEPLLAGAGALLARAAPAMLLGGASLLALKFVLATVVLLPPTVLMGTTLPLLAQATGRAGERLGERAGGLYAVNTMGAAIGSLLVPAVLLPALGAQVGLLAASGASLCIGALAIAVGRGEEAASAPASAPAPAPAPARSSSRARSLSAVRVEGPRGLLMLAFLSGAFALALETLWARMLALVHENSVYSFATVVAVFLLGLALGAALARTLIARRAGLDSLLTTAWIGAGACVLAVPALFVRVTGGLEYVSDAGLLAQQLHVGALAGALLLAPTVLAGAVLPVLMQRAGAAEGAVAGAAIGRLLVANTAGAILGPITALFVLGPALGLWWAIALLGAAMIVTGAWSAGWKGRAAAAGALLGGLTLANPGALPRVHLKAGDRLLQLREGPLGTVAAVDRDGDSRLLLNNYYVLGGTASTGEERLQAHLPLLLHPAPARVGFLGMGTGITAGAALFHPVQSVTVAELVPQVVDMARVWFRDANGGLLEDRRVRVITDDARSVLAGSPGAFDVIVGDLVVPYRRGEGSLYTRESFCAARKALAPGGLYAQWLPLFQLSEADFDSIAGAFVDVFPRTLLWRGDFRAGESALALVGFLDDAPLDPVMVDARVRSLAARPDPGNPYLEDAAGVWVYFAGALAPGDAHLRGVQRNTDGHPIVELRAAAVHLGTASGAPDAFSGAPGAFIGEQLAGRLAEWRDASLAGTPAERLDAEHLAWRDAGLEIWRASLLSLRGHDAEADEKGLAALASLPPALQRAVLGRVISP